MAPLLLHTEKHVLIQASTRSGKGVAILLPHLLRYRGSVFCLDPKGENAKAAGRFRESVNDKTHYLDPFGITGKKRSRFNPLARFTPANMEAESKALARAFVLTEGPKNDDHWNASAQQLLALTILYVVTEPVIPPERKDLITVRRLLLTAMKETLETAKKSDLPGGLLSELADSFLQTPEREFGSILSHAQRNTEILDNPYIRACLAASGDGEEIDFADWRKGTMSVFLCLSAPKFPVFNRWLRMVLTAALDEMTDRLDPPPLPVAFVLDEVATLGHLQVLENAVGLAAGYGIQLIYVYQDTAQMRDLYQGRWASFVSNAGVRALFNLDDFDTAQYWSKTIGSHTIESRSQNQNIYGLTSGQTVAENIVPLMAPEDIMLRFAKDVMLILPQGSHPVITRRVPYYADAGLAGRWDDPRVAVPEPAPPEPLAPLPVAA
jgi:type IV secretion system protein VirD4